MREEGRVGESGRKSRGKKRKQAVRRGESEDREVAAGAEVSPERQHWAGRTEGECRTRAGSFPAFLLLALPPLSSPLISFTSLN